WGRPPDDVVDVERVRKCHAGVTVAEGLAVAARGRGSSGVGADKVALYDVAAVRVVGVAVAPGHDATAGSVARGAVARDHVAGYGVVDRPREEDSAGDAAGGGLAVAESLAAEDVGADVVVFHHVVRREVPIEAVRTDDDAVAAVARDDVPQRRGRSADRVARG